MKNGEAVLVVTVWVAVWVAAVLTLLSRRVEQHGFAARARVRSSAARAEPLQQTGTTEDALASGVSGDLDDLMLAGAALAADTADDFGEVGESVDVLLDEESARCGVGVVGHC
jgi:hypothetical protein